jgi:hypothetical protein
MAKYKITNIDEKGKVTFQILSGSTVIMTDTRQDLPVESKEEVDEILSKFANDVEADFVSTVTVDPELTKIVNKAQEAKISVAVDEPVEV